MSRKKKGPKGASAARVNANTATLGLWPPNFFSCFLPAFFLSLLAAAFAVTEISHMLPFLTTVPERGLFSLGVAAALAIGLAFSGFDTMKGTRLGYSILRAIVCLIALLALLATGHGFLVDADAKVPLILPGAFLAALVSCALMHSERMRALVQFCVERRERQEAAKALLRRQT